LLCATDALHLDSTSRRTALTSALAAVTTLQPRVSVANDDGTQLGEGGALGSTCLGFGCNSYGRPDFNGLEKAPPGSLPYPEFLEAVKQKKVEGVVFMPPSGDVAYALIGGKRVRIGKGWPIATSNSWSDPTWVARILQNEDVPYVFDYDLSPAKKKSYPKPGEKKAYTPYVPSKQAATRPEDGTPPKMYGSGDAEENRLTQMLLEKSG